MIDTFRFIKVNSIFMKLCIYILINKNDIFEFIIMYIHILFHYNLSLNPFKKKYANTLNPIINPISIYIQFHIPIWKSYKSVGSI